MIWFLVGCLDRLLEGPLVLASNMGEVRSLALEGEFLLVGSDQGLFRVDGRGQVEPVLGVGEVRAVTTHPGTRYVLGGTRLSGSGKWSGSVEVVGGRDILAGYEGEVIILYENGKLERFFPDDGRRIEWEIAGGMGAARGLALCQAGEVCVVGDRGLWTGKAGESGGTMQSWECLEAVAMDRGERLFGAGCYQGATIHLFRIGAPPVLAARFLEGVQDMHFGPGGLLSTENLYLAGGGSGQVLYVRPF